MRIVRYKVPATDYLLVLTNPAMRVLIGQRVTIAILDGPFRTLKKAGHIGGCRLEDATDEMNWKPTHIVRVS
jgi:hypothetical protein